MIAQLWWRVRRQFGATVDGERLLAEAKTYGEGENQFLTFGRALSEEEVRALREAWIRRHPGGDAA